MYAYYRTTQPTTVIKNILHGHISNEEATDIIVVKENTLEWLTIQPNPLLLTRQLQQFIYGRLLDSALLHCHWNEQEPMKEEIEPNEDFRLYSKHIRNHSIVNGNDVLVLLSEYGRLLFMSIYHEGAIRRYETLSEVQLSSPGLEYDKIGKKLAVDPYGRAIAVASFEDNMDVFILHKTSSRSYFDPISVRVSIAEEGIIWHMEFLHTESTSRERILLAVVIYSDIEKICRVILYSMNASTDDVTIETIGRLPLEKNTPLPVLLIPLKFMHESFILVTEQQVCLLSSDDLGCGNVLYPTSYIPRELGSTEYPLFTAYSPHLNPSEHYLYLGAAEGLLYKLQVNVSTSTMQWISIDDVNPVSQAMCMVGELIHSDDGKDLSTADIIFYTGESSNSQMIAITQEETTNNKLHYRTLQIFDNWAPITNFQVASNLRSYQDALVTCSGQDKYGSLGVVSYGVDAILLFSSKPEWKGVSQLWSLSLSSTMAVSYLVASSLIDTRLISFEDGHMKDITFPSKIRNNLHTLHANIFSIKGINYLLQIYSNGISITQRDENRANTLYECALKDICIDLATSWSETTGFYIALCSTKNKSSQLQLYKVNQDSILSGKIGQSIQSLNTIPINVPCSYIGYFHTRTRSFLAVGSYKPSITFLYFKNDSIFVAQDVDLNELCHDPCYVPHSAAIISKSEGPSYFVIGLREGSIMTFMLTNDTESVIQTTTPASIHRIGSLPVYFPPSENSQSVYALSEELWRIRYLEKIEMEQVLLPKFNRPISSFAFFIRSELLAVIADDRLHVFKLGTLNGVNIQKMKLGETPKRVIYDASSNYFIAMSVAIKGGIRRNSIALIDPTTGEQISNNQLLCIDSDYGRSDIVLSAAEWSVKNKEREYKYLCVGIGHLRDSFHSFRSGMATKVSKAMIDRGTLLLFRLKLKRSSGKGIVLKKVWAQENLPGGVFSICPHSDSTLLFSAGCQLYLFRLDPTEAKLNEVAQRTLRFPITSISQHGSTICVSSQSESMSFYRFNPDTGTLDFLKSDVQSRTIHQTLMLNDNVAVGVGQSGGMVALCDNPDDLSFEKRLECLFAFHYPDVLVNPQLGLLCSQNNLEKNLLVQYLMPWNKETIIKPIVCCTVSGGLVHVYRLNPVLFRSLHALQTMLLNYEPTRPLLGSTKDFVDWYCQLSGEEKNIIHGDLIESFLKLTLTQQLSIVQMDQPICAVLMESMNELNKDNSSRNMTPTDIVHFLVDILTGFQRYY